MYSHVIDNAKTIWDYLKSFHNEGASDALVVCCSYDLRVCDYAVSLLKKTDTKKIIFSGNTGNWTKELWNEREATIFKARAVKLGITPENIITEENATNIGENISFSKKLLKDVKKLTYISKPNTLLRIGLTIPVHYNEIESYTSAPDFSFPEDVSNIVGVYGLINEMVGDLQRIIEYPSKGFQIKHDLPIEIIKAYKFLVNKGYTSHLM